MKFKKLWIWLFMLLLLFWGQLANSRKFGFGGRKAPIVLENAEILRNITREEETIRILINDVKLSQEDIDVECDYAEFYTESRKVFLRGNVLLRDSVKLLTADEVTYYEVTGVAYALGNVFLREEDNRLIRCRRLEYDYDKGLIHYRGDISIQDSSEYLVVTGQLGNYDEFLRTSEMIVEPKLVKYDSTWKNPIIIQGKTIWFNDSLRQAKVVENVSVVQDTLVATGNYLFYDDSLGYAELTKQAQLKRGKETMTADTMYFFFKDQKLTELRAFGKIIALSPADSSKDAPMNRLTGKQLFSYFQNDEPKEMIVIGNAISKYYLRENQKDNGLNVASGDTLKIYFKNKKIEQIQVIGGVEGTYYPVGWKGEIKE
ncbi:MAG: hypothetical protein N2450_09265 [bacterium]|nr:hypothetical protein [bacterium]